MILSKRWFPQGLPARALWMLNFATQFAAVALSLGFTQADIDVVENDNTVMQFLADIFNQAEAYKDAVRQYRVQITEYDIGKPTPQFPEATKFELPVVVPTGIFERIDRLRTKIMAADGYTDEIGALLKILPQSDSKIPEGEVLPTIKCFPAKINYTFSIVVADRAEADMWDVYILRKGAANWTKAGTFTGKSADIVIEPTTPGEAEQIQVRVQLRRKNQNYGDPSQVEYVTVSP